MSRDLIKDLFINNGYDWTEELQNMPISILLDHTNNLIDSGKLKTTKENITKTDLSKLESNLKEAKEKEKSTYGKYITTGVSFPEFRRVSSEDLLVKAEEVEELEIDTKLAEASEKAVAKITPPPTFLQAKRLLNDETAVKKALEFAKLKANPPTNVDVKTLEEKETEYIKNYVENGILGEVDFKQDTDLLIPGAADLVAGVESKESIDLRGQIEKETEYIKSIIDKTIVTPTKDSKGSINCPPGYRLDEATQVCVLIDDKKLNEQLTSDDTGGGQEGGDGNRTQSPTNTEQIDLNNIPVGSQVWDVDGTLYLAYAVPGAGDLYTGSTIWMAYDVVGNDLFEAGLLTEGFNYTGPNMSVTKEWFDKTAIIGGNTNQLIGIEDDPFASFVETYKEEAALRPWLLDNDFIELQAEAALENRDMSPTEWQSTTWYQTNNQAKRDWMDIELSDPAEAKRKRDDLELHYKNQLQGLGVAGVPDGLVQWVTNMNITGKWSDLKTSEQLQLFADPFKSGYRDEELLNLISTSGFGDVDRTAAREREVVELYRKWLGPSLGSLTQDEVANIAGSMRDDPDYEDALINSLKQSRLAAFSNYTNPELTYEDIARPWRNLTTSVWGQNADETQGWWQEMVKSNDYTTAQATLRERGLENNIAQVNIQATEALQQALGQGSVSQSGVNV